MAFIELLLMQSFFKMGMGNSMAVNVTKTSWNLDVNFITFAVCVNKTYPETLDAFFYSANAHALRSRRSVYEARKLEGAKCINSSDKARDNILSNKIELEERPS